MDLAEAQEFLRDHHHAVLATRRRDGGPQMSPVIVVLDDEGRIMISSREPAFKVRNLRRDPRASLCVLSDHFFPPWILVEGNAEMVPLPEAMELLVQHYKGASGEHPDWDEYRQAMQDQRRLIIRIPIERVGPDRHR